MADRVEQIRAAAERVAASHGLDVVDLELVGPAKERTLRIYLEKTAGERARLKAEYEAAAAAGQVAGEESGTIPRPLAEGRFKAEQLSWITHEDCSEFSRDFGVLLDVEELVPGDSYTLEASSPGLDRKLAKAEDFVRFAGCLAKVQTFEPIRNNRHWQGRLMAAGEASDMILLDLAAVKQNSKSRKAGGATVEIALGNIEKAQLVPEI